jgi:hypothetical protein
MNLEPPLLSRKRSSMKTILKDDLNRTKHSKVTAASFFSAGATTPKLDRDKRTEDKTTEETISSEIRNRESDRITVDSKNDDPEFMKQITRDIDQWRTRRAEVMGRTRRPQGKYLAA